MRKAPFVATVAILVLVADQLTKVWLRSSLQPGESVAVIDSFFHIVRACNPGGAFSLFAGGHESWRVPFFIGAATVAIGALIGFLRQVRPDQRLLQFALAGVLGGALGNLVDRAWFHCVTDFLDVHVNGYHWPAFNVADSFISVGVLILFLTSMFEGEKPAVGEGTKREE